MAKPFQVYRKLPIVGVAAADVSRDGIVVVDTMTTPDSKFVSAVVSHFREIHGEANGYAGTATETDEGWMYFVYDRERYSFEEACEAVRAGFSSK